MRLEIRATDDWTLDKYIEKLSEYNPKQETFFIKNYWDDELEEEETYTIEIKTLQDLKDIQKILIDNHGKMEFTPTLIIDFYGVSDNQMPNRPNIEIYNDWRE